MARIRSLNELGTIFDYLLNFRIGIRSRVAIGWPTGNDVMLKLKDDLFVMLSLNVEHSVLKVLLDIFIVSLVSNINTFKTNLVLSWEELATVKSAYTTKSIGWHN